MAKTFSHDAAARVKLDGPVRAFPRVGAWCRVPGESKTGIIFELARHELERNGVTTAVTQVAEVHLIDPSTGETVEVVPNVPTEYLTQALATDIPECRLPKVVELQTVQGKFDPLTGKKTEDGAHHVVSHTVTDKIDHEKLDRMGYRKPGVSRLVDIHSRFKATLVVPNNGEGLAIKAFLNHTAGQNGKLNLFKSNTTPAETDTSATYTNADFTGYSADTAITGSSYTVVEGAPTSATYAQQTWTSSADQATQNVYGYYMKQTTSGTIMWAERFSDGPYPITNNGDAIKVTPAITVD